MITDIIFDSTPFLIEILNGTPGGTIQSYSSDGFGYDFDAESIHVFIT